MTELHPELDGALQQVFAAARAHLAAVRAADGRIDDDEVWQTYVALNNASSVYDDLLLDAFGEVTPWDVEMIDPDQAGEQFVRAAGDTGPVDPHPRVVSVRQRRDYRVPSVAALLRAAEAARRAITPDGAGEETGVESVGAAVLELVQAGDGSLGALDVPELEPLDGVVTVTEVDQPLDIERFAPEDGVGPFQAGGEDRLVGRLDEHPYLDLALGSAGPDEGETAGPEDPPGSGDGSGR